MTYTFDMYQTLGIAVVMLLVGEWLRKRITILQKYCIPAPVIGGLIFALIMTMAYGFGGFDFKYDDTVKDICMVMFFASVGFQADLKVLKSGGISLIIFLVIITALVFAQNGTSLGIASLLGVDSKVGLATGSIPMLGGHGTAGAFGPILEDFGLTGATAICTAAATYGLIAGSIMGGPLAQSLIRRHHLLEKAGSEAASVTETESEETKRYSLSGYASAAYQLTISMGLGTVVTWLLSLTGLKFPKYIGALIVALLMRNIGDRIKPGRIRTEEINGLGSISLNIFLGIAMITLKMWQMAALALPMLLLLLAQTVLMFLFARFIVFNFMGRDYDAAVLAAGTCGFGMGATPNAMANMQAVTGKYRPSVKAYLLVPIVGGMFSDIINSLTITLFINMI